MSDSATFNTTFTETEAFNMTFDAEETFKTEMTQIVKVMSSDHRELSHRDAEEQHPIEAITNLAPELVARPSAALSNTDIQNILNT